MPKSHTDGNACMVCKMDNKYEGLKEKQKLI